MYCMDNAGSDGAIFMDIVGCFNFTEAKSREVCTVLLKDACKNGLHLVLEYVKNCRSGALFVGLSCSAGQILVQSLQV